MTNRPGPFRALLLAALLLNFAAIGWLAQQQYARHGNRFVTLADNRALEGDLDAAITAFNLHLEHYPGDGSVRERLETARLERDAQLRQRVAARLALADRIGAISALADFIVLHPGDGEARLRMGDLLTESGDLAGSEGVYRRIMADPQLGEETREFARRRTYLLVNRRANELKREADRLLATGNLAEPATLYEQVIALRARNPALELGGTDRTLAMAALDAVIASRAFALWLGKTTSDPVTELATPFDTELAIASTEHGIFLAERMRTRKTRLSNLIWDWADQRRAGQQWEEAELAYRVAMTIRESMAENSHDLSLAALNYNLAYAEFAQGKYARAHDRLTRLKAATPEYDRNLVMNLMEEISMREDRAR